MIGLKGNLRSKFQAKSVRQLTSQEWGDPPQCREQYFDVGSTKTGYEHRRALQVRPHPNFRYCYDFVGNIRIMDLASAEQFRQDMTDLLGHPQLSLLRSQRPLSQAGTISVSKHSTTSPSCRS